MQSLWRQVQLSLAKQLVGHPAFFLEGIDRNFEVQLTKIGGKVLIANGRMEFVTDDIGVDDRDGVLVRMALLKEADALFQIKV